MQALGYRKEFDGLRGIAIVLVMVSHMGVPALSGGFIGVDIFFVLSGLLITLLLVQEFDRNSGAINFRNFYLRRALRLGPALLLFLAVYLALGLSFGKDRTTHITRALITLFYVSNWVQAFDVYEMRLLSHTWSLSIEEQFYILWPVILYLLLKRFLDRGRIIAAIGILVILISGARAILTALGVPWGRIHLGLDTRADPLLVGCMLGLALSSARLRSTLKRHVRLIGILAAAGCVLLIERTVNFDTFTERVHQYHLWGLGLVEIAVACVVLHVYLGARSPLHALLSWRPLVRIGQVSYGLYLWHATIITASFEGLKSRVDITRPGNVFVIATLATAVALAITFASYRWVEAPVLRLKRLFPAGRTADGAH